MAVVQISRLNLPTIEWDARKDTADIALNLQV